MGQGIVDRVLDREFSTITSPNNAIKRQQEVVVCFLRGDCAFKPRNAVIGGRIRSAVDCGQ